MITFYSACRFLAGTVLGAASGWRVVGRERLPLKGGLIVASNHVSFFDPPLVGSASSRELYFLAKEELFQIPVLGPLITALRSIPIRRGVADMSGLSRTIEVLKRGEGLLLFPEGSRMKDGELHPARPGVGMLSVHADVPIVPCFISGSNRPGQWWNRRSRVRITFGGAHDWRELAGAGSDLTPGRSLYQRIGDGVMREIAELRTEQQQSMSRGAA